MMSDRQKQGDYRVFFDLSSDLMLRVDDQGRILEANKSWFSRLGLNPELCLGQNWRNFVAPQDHVLVEPDLEAVPGKQGSTGRSLSLIHQDGSELSVIWQQHPDLSAGESCHLFRDQSLVKRFEDELRKVQLVDDMSGALSRRHFLNRAFEELLRSVRYQSDMTLLLIDIDDLGGINDRHGQYHGDQVIRRVARLCMQKLRNTDLFGRMGGGTFAALLVETPVDGAQVIAERLRELIAEEELFASQEPVRVTVSLGLSGKETGDVSIEDMLNRTETILSRAKSAGGNCVYSDLQ